MGPVRFFVPYKRRKRDGGLDDELRGKLSQTKCEKRTLSNSNGAKTEEATGSLHMYLATTHILTIYWPVSKQKFPYMVVH